MMTPMSVALNTSGMPIDKYNCSLVATRRLLLKRRWRRVRAVLRLRRFQLDLKGLLIFGQIVGLAEGLVILRVDLDQHLALRNPGQADGPFLRGAQFPG